MRVTIARLLRQLKESLGMEVFREFNRKQKLSCKKSMLMKIKLKLKLSRVQVNASSSCLLSDVQRDG